MNINFVCSQTRGAISQDDILAAHALEQEGFKVRAVFWDDPDHPWTSENEIYINRSTWDYHLQPDLFSEWLDKMEDNDCQLLNSVSTIRKNLSKEYLLSFEQAVPTTIVNVMELENLSHILHAMGEEHFVIKPKIGASGILTHRINLKESNCEGLITDIIRAYKESQNDMLIQPYIEEVETHGEYSLIFFNNEFSHAVLKKPKAKDFRVQSHFGGFARFVEEPKCSLINQAQNILESLEDIPLYARVDGFFIDDQFMLAELELNEPYLWFEYQPNSSKLFANAIKERV